MGTWRENSNLSQKIGGSVSCHSLVNAGIENSPDEVDGGRCTKTGVGLGSTNEGWRGVNEVALNSVLILLRVTSYKMIL